MNQRIFFKLGMLLDDIRVVLMIKYHQNLQIVSQVLMNMLLLKSTELFVRPTFYKFDANTKKATLVKY